MTWGFTGYREKPKPRNNEATVERKPDSDQPVEKPWEDDSDWRADERWRQEPEEIYSDLRGRFLWRNVEFPHVLAIALGTMLFIAAASLNAAGLERLHL